jgi:hypothetical protein
MDESKLSKEAEQLLTDAQPTIDKAKKLKVNFGLVGNISLYKQYERSLKRLTRISLFKGQQETLEKLKQSSQEWYRKLANLIEAASKKPDEAIRQAKKETVEILSLCMSLTSI